MNGTTAIVQVRARQDMHGRLLSLQTILIGGTSAIGGPLLGWIADIAGARALMVLGGVTCLVSTIFGYVAIRHYREQIAAPQEK